MAIQIIPILKAITPLIVASSGIVATLGERLAHPTGARGWMYAWKHTDEARQILVTGVAKGSPADGVLQADDVILGVNGKPFADDARIQFARALMSAEQEASKGVLSLANPHFPALRSDPMALSGASRRKQITSSHFADPWALPNPASAIHIQSAGVHALACLLRWRSEDRLKP